METIGAGGSIRLGQFLKFANLADSGAQARELIAAGLVKVDGEVETRRGRQLHGGEVVEVQPSPGQSISAAWADTLAPVR